MSSIFWTNKSSTPEIKTRFKLADAWLKGSPLEATMIEPEPESNLKLEPESKFDLEVHPKYEPDQK